MSYATNTTIITLLPNMPSSLGAAGYVRITDQISSHITRADALINGKLAIRYNVSQFDTTGSVPPLLRMLSEDIASYYTFRSQFSSDGQNDNEWTDKFADAIEMLNQIRDGEIDLVDTSGSLIGTLASSTVDIISSNTEDWTPTFGEDDVLSWKVDDDKLDNYDDSRD